MYSKWSKLVKTKILLDVFFSCAINDARERPLSRFAARMGGIVTPPMHGIVGPYPAQCLK